MGSNTMLICVLMAMFVMAGTQHLIVFARRRGAIEHFWFGAMSFAAAGAATAHCTVFLATASVFSQQYLPTLFGGAWLVSATWFGVQYSAGDSKRRWIALFSIVLVALSWAGGLWFAPAGHRSFSSLPGLLQLTGLLALAVMFPLGAEGALRLWSSGRRMRAVVLAGVSCILGLAATSAVLLDMEFATLQPPALCAFLIVVLLMTFEVAGAIGNGEDVPPRQQQELAHASRLSVVGELTASIAHEINQPLGAILSNADAGEILLENPDPPLHEIKQILADIRRDGLRASDVIRHVRKLVRKRELELERVDANALATGVVALLGPEARKRRIPIVATPWAQSAYLSGDRALLEQVLINLVMNAMDAVETANATDDAISPIDVRVSTTRHGEIEFHVVDAGAGIPADRLEQLFDSFYTSKAHGMGLGLSIARSIVEAHGGRIRAENNPGAGATFWVTLPPFDVTGASLMP